MQIGGVEVDSFGWINESCGPESKFGQYIMTDIQKQVKLLPDEAEAMNQAKDPSKRRKFSARDSLRKHIKQGQLMLRRYALNTTRL
ncbi:MAG: hypothetical protein ACP5OR_02040 [Candidatus Dormibacteria bacterium]